jgi:hypothetical protein
MALPVITNIRLHTLDAQYITVEWDIEPTSLDLVQYAVEVWRSESEGGPYQRVSMTMVAADVFDFRDAGVNLLSKWRNYFYRVRVINRNDTSEFCDFGSEEVRKVIEGADPGGVILETPPDLYALEAIRRFNLVLREHGGRRCLVSVQRTWQQRCSECWDHLKRRKKKSGCQTCWDTGVAGGFFQPMEAWMMKPPHKVVNQLTPLFELQADDRVMWFSRYPRLKPRDLVHTIEGDKFRVIAISRSEKAGALTRQTVQIRRLSRDQVEYKMPVSQEDWKRDMFTVTAMREHIRATDIDSYYSAVRRKGVADEELFPERSDFATTQESSNAPVDP